MASEKDTLNEFIIQGFARGLNREAVIAEVCKQFDLGERQAEGVVTRVETVYEREIEIRRSPAYLFWSVLLLLVGVSMAIYGLWEMLQPVIAAMQDGAGLQQALGASTEPILAAVPFFVLGIALGIGGYRGVHNTIWIIKRKPF